jgi:ATP-dependent exoDNAse (exonuclease V) alpha subunit
MTQENALEILKTGKNVFLTGPAGSGKTYLLNKYINYLKDNKIKVAITASTGLAATHLNGRTIHSWSGIGIEEKMNRRQVDNLKNDEDVFARVNDAQVLIIDEISMLNANRLDLVNNICQALRQDLRPFGGLQIVLCGDFFQLPPVSKKNEDRRFVVESLIWSSMYLNICYLNEQYRQEDNNLLKILSAIRNNSVDKNIMKILNERLNKPIISTIRPTKLHTHNKNVDLENNFELSKLNGKNKKYQMTSQGITRLIKTLKANCLASEELVLKKDAVVMFIKNNFSKGYVNGTLGKVIDFDNESGLPIIEILSGKKIIAERESWVVEEANQILASIKQIPLRLAWSITVHKSQGMSLDCAEMDLRNTFEYGMGYVALSRVRTLKGIKLLGINNKALQVNQKVVDLDKIFFSESKI